MKKIIIVALLFAAYYWIKNRNNAQGTSQTVDSTLKPSWLLTSSNLKASTPVVNTGTTGGQTNSGTGSNSSDSSGSGEPPVAKGSGQFTVTPAFGLHSKSNSCFK